MWYWFTRKGEVEEVKSESGDTPLTCSALIDFASTLTANDWAPFLTMTRDHDINTLKQDEVKDLFARYKEDGGVSSDPDVCTPRQLAEFIYLLTPERWDTFLAFSRTVDINSLSFSNLLFNFLNFECEHIMKRSSAVPSEPLQPPTSL